MEIMFGWLNAEPQSFTPKLEVLKQEYLNGRFISSFLLYTCNLFIWKNIAWKVVKDKTFFFGQIKT